MKIRHRFLWAAARGVSAAAVTLGCELNLTVTHPLPVGAIIVAPHRSTFDVPVGLVTFNRLGLEPLIVVSARQLANLRVGRINWVAMEVLPVERGGDSKLKLLELGAQYLASNRHVAIMPEGQVLRNGAEGRSAMGRGAAELATLTNRPVIVLGSHGTSNCWRKGELKSFVGRKSNKIEVVVHEVLEPKSDASSTHALIIKTLIAAERSAESLASARIQQL